MKSEQCQIVKYRPEYKRRLIKLQAHLWGRDSATRSAYLDWKYGRNPYTDDTYIYLAFYNKKLAGMVGAYGIKWQAGDLGQTFPALCFADLVIHPRHRQRNLFPQLMAYALNDLSNTSYTYLFDLGATHHVALGLLMQGWRSTFIQTASRRIDCETQSGHLVENEQRLSRLAVVNRQIRGQLEKIPILVATYRWLRGYIYEPVLRRVTGMQRAFVDLDRNAERFKINPHIALSKTARPQAMAELVRRIGYDGRIRHIRDKQYFRWRFQNPLSEYRFLFWNKERLDGYIVLHSKADPQRDKACAYIVDWEVTNAKVWIDLFQAVLQWGIFGQLHIWTATLSSEMKTVLKKFGFKFSDMTGSFSRDIKSKNILVKPLGQKNQPTSFTIGGRSLVNAAEWDLRMIYSDDY